VEVQQYRAFCLIALGRADEAQRAIEDVVVANPGYVPAAMEVSPRVQEVFNRTRRQLLPEIARQRYVDAKRALDRKDREVAEKGFGALIELIDSADSDLRASLDELRFLAAGFLDLSVAMRPSAPAPAEPPLAVPLTGVQVAPAVAVRQDMPRWAPADSAARQSFTGAIRVVISAAGKVDAVSVIRPSHPSYDRQLLQSALSWEYLPARRDGVAVPSEQVVEVQLKPKQ
jgi:TonB family protein